MDTSAHNPGALAKTLAVALALSIAGVLMMASRSTSGSAAMQERVFEDKIPSHIPFKIKLKKEREESFKDLKNEKWLRDFEIELTNTGNKPIYFLSIVMGTDVKVDGQEIVFPLWYGRPELGDIVTKAGPDDIPINPGETHVFRLGEMPAWERGVRENRWPQATKFKAELQSLSFGDGTGYFGTSLYPPAEKPRAALNDKGPQSQKGRARPHERVRKRALQAKASWTVDRPTNFLSAKFLSSEASTNVLLNSTSEAATSCLFPQCVTVIPWSGYVCYDNEQRDSCRIQNRPQPNPIGVCRELEFTRVLCTAGTVDYFCQAIKLHECGFGPPPTSTPSASPTPQSCQYCTDPNAVRPADCSDPANPKCDPFLEYQQNGCCYKQTCERVAVVPPPPQPCPPRLLPQQQPVTTVPAMFLLTLHTDSRWWGQQFLWRPYL
jgi:hypothetical protein